MKSFLLIIFAGYATLANSQADRKFIRKGNGEFSKGRFQQAEIEYRKALEKDPGSYKADYNLGNALYKQKQYEAAANKYTSLVQNENKSADFNSYYYNLGNALFEHQKYGESAEAYKNALRNDPRDMDAKHNLMLALRMLHEMNQQQKKDNKSDRKDQKSNKQDQGNQNQSDKDNQNNTGQKEGNKNDQPSDHKQPQGAKGQISREDAERILQALENEEKDVVKKIQNQKEHRQKEPLEKNW